MSLIKMPISILFLIFNEFFQQINYRGFRAIIINYITEVLRYNKTTGKIIYRTFAVLVYLMAIFGAIFADSFWGKFKTIFYMSLVYVVGNVTMSLATIEPCGFEPSKFMLVGIALIAIGSGGIRPCVPAFGGDQFILPNNKKGMNTFFHLLYFVINIAIVLTSLITPLLVKHVHCFGKSSCYPLPFFLATILMIIAVCIFVSGKPFYNIEEPGQNVLVQMSRCIGCAIKNRYKHRNVEKDHWLDFAIEEHGQEMVNDIKRMFEIIVLIYFPMPLFWVLSEHLETSWIFQARQTNGEIGEYNIPPEKLSIVKPLAIIIMIPLFNYAIYPVFTKLRFLSRPLQRMAVGGLLASLSYVITGLVALRIERSLEPFRQLPTFDGYFYRMTNVLPCKITNDIFGAFEQFQSKEGFVFRKMLDARHSIIVRHPGDNKCYKISWVLSFYDYQFVIIPYLRSEFLPYTLRQNQSLRSDQSVNPKVMTLINLNNQIKDTEVIRFYINSRIKPLEWSVKSYILHELPFPGNYTIAIGDFKTKQEFRRGGIYHFLAIAKSSKQFDIKNTVIVKPFTTPSYIMLPQYFVFAAAEIMMSVTGLEFSYSQAPIRMKSGLQACWMLTFAFGQLLFIILESMRCFHKSSSMLFLYAAIMMIDILVFMIFSGKYKYVTQE